MTSYAFSNIGLVIDTSEEKVLTIKKEHLDFGMSREVVRMSDLQNPPNFTGFRMSVKFADLKSWEGEYEWCGKVVVQRIADKVEEMQFIPWSWSFMSFECRTRV